jgi:hypothetical protein
VLRRQAALQAVSDPDARGGHLPEGYTVKKRKLVKAKKGDKVRLAA